MVHKSELSFDYVVFIFIEAIDFLKMIEYNMTEILISREELLWS